MSEKRKCSPGWTTVASADVGLIRRVAEVTEVRVEVLAVGQYFPGDTAFVHPGQIGISLPGATQEEAAKFRTEYLEELKGTRG